jgi:hypothetical protein
MTLYLSSDEKTLDESNTRTKFKNRILPDFFKDESFNLKLHEIFFDSKFPTLANFEYPHIITTVIGQEHKLKDFPEKFQKNKLFQYLCKNHRNYEISPLLIERATLFDSHLSEIDFEVFYEIHPRLNLAFSIAFIKDISIQSQKDVADFLNSYMFPFHKEKPLKYMGNGYIAIESNLNIFLSNTVFQLLGFNNFESEVYSKHLYLPSRNIYIDTIFPEDSAPTSYTDMLQILEEESPLYKNYRALEIQKPKVWFQVEFTIGSSLKHFEIEFELDLFNQRTKAISYDEELDRINRLALFKYLSVLKEYVLNLKITSTEEDTVDLSNLVVFLSKNEKRKIKGLESWGGLFTLKRANKNVHIDVFHTNKNREAYKSFHSNINKLPGAHLVKEFSSVIYNLSNLVSISFSPTLCYFLGLSKSTSSSIKLQMKGEEEKLLPFPLNYYKSARHELGKLSPENIYFGLQLMQIEEEYASFSKSIKLIKTDQGNMFMIDKQGGKLLADESINLKTNSPQLIFVIANFVQHSLVGSNQRKILNFFPLPKNSNAIVHHRFKSPMILKTIPGSVFHINLVDENFDPIKADIGTPTLLALKKSLEENMFPVTLISSDKTNLKLFPENKPNLFRNKLSFPLLLNHEHRWGVSLRSLAYPKVMNVFSKYCFFTAKKIGQEQTVMISLDNAYVTTGTKFIYLLNQKVQDTLSSFFKDAVFPTFSLKDGFASIETNDFECNLNGDLLKILGLTHSYQDNGIIYHPQSSIVGVLEMNLFLLQPQEMIIISNIVEESFYAQQRPKILKIVPISTNQSDFNAYNYIQFEDDDTIPVKLDRIDEIEISIMTRKGDQIDFVDLHDVKCQLEFKRMS